MNNQVARREDLSVEHCLRGVIRVCKHPDVNTILENCKAIVINSGIDLAFLITRDEQNPPDQRIKIRVFFRYLRTDEYYRKENGETRGHGRMMMVSCLNKLKRWIIDNRDSKGNAKDFETGIIKGIHDGLWRMMLQFNAGYFPNGSKKEILIQQDSVLKECYKTIYSCEKEEWDEKTCYCETQDVEVIVSGINSTVENQIDIHCNHFSKKFKEFSFIQVQGTAIDTARKIVKQSFEKLLLEEKEKIKFPLERFGQWTVVDPDEIVNYRFIMMQMREYNSRSQTSPLALAVFGPPGSGKTSGIKQVSIAAFGCESDEDLALIECNLSQFTSPEQLATKLHDAQDMVLRGKTPIVFLDEFDSFFEKNKYGWFKYLLSVLQAGVFKSGNSEYHLGKAIVVCAGGVNHSFRQFNQLCEKDHVDHKDFCEVKGPDLISRLRGIIDIKGPNKAIDVTSPNNADDHHQFRRAFLLRNLLQNHKPEIFDIDEDGNFGTAKIEGRVLDAFLDEKTKYLHGVRSMRALIEMSGATSRIYKTFVAAMIPPSQQLEIHVNPEFLDKINGPEF